jgi:hypothetical protein
MFNSFKSSYIAVMVVCALSIIGVGMLLAPLLPYIFLCYYHSAEKTKTPNIRLYSYAGFVLLSIIGVFYSKGFILFLLITVVPAYILSILRKKKIGTFYTVFLPTLPAVIYLTVIILVPEIRTALQEYVVKVIEQLYSSINVSDVERLSDNSLNIIYNNRREYALSTIMLFPAIVFSTVVITIYFTDKVYYNLNEPLPVIPDYFLFVLALGGALTLLNEYFSNLKYLGFSLLIVGGSVYFIRGFAMIMKYLNRLKVTKPLKVFIIIVVLLQTFLMVIVAIIGLISVFKNPLKKK